MLSWLAHTDWVMVVWTVVIAVCAAIVYGRFAYGSLRSLDRDSGSHFPMVACVACRDQQPS